jgi:hypothetical protein
MRVASLIPFCLVCATAVAQAEEKTPAARDVFRLRVERKRVVLVSSLPSTAQDEILPVKFGGFSGTAEVQYPSTAAAAEGEKKPAFFKLEVNSDDGRPGERVAVRVTWAHDMLDLQYSVHYTGEFRYTRLTRLISPGHTDDNDRPRREGADDRSVVVKVTEAGRVGHEPVHASAEEQDLFTLVRKHQGGVELYLRPVLRDLGQEALLAPEPALAWQVFAAQWNPSDALKKEVNAILPKLDAQGYAERESASKDLAKLGPEAAMLAMQLDRSKLSAEQNTRLDSLVAANTPITRGEATQLRDDVTFLLDCLSSDDEPIRAAAVERLRAVCRRPIEFDPKADSAARDRAVAVLRNKLKQ